MFLPVGPSIRYFSRCRDGTSACYQGKFHAHNTFLVKVKGGGGAIHGRGASYGTTPQLTP